MLILRVLEHLGFECPSSFELVHHIAPIGATFLKMSKVQKKKLVKSKKKSKQARVDLDVDVVVEGDDNDSFDEDVGAVESTIDPTATPYN